MSNLSKSTPPAPEDEITLGWLLENPITRARMICTLAGIVADFNDLDAASPEAANPDTRDLWFLTNKTWRTINRSEIDGAFRSLRERTETRRSRRSSTPAENTASPSPSRHRQSGFSARTPLTGS